MKNKNILNLHKKICLVTGCNGYIGKKIVKKYSDLGAIVIGTDIKVRKKNKGIKSFFKLDLNNKPNIDEFIKALKKKYKKIDVLVNNASYVGTSNLDDKKENKLFYNEDYENLNLRNTIYFTNKLSSLLMKSKKASVINICSIYSFLGYDYNLYRGTKMRAPIAYGVSKAGLSHYSKMLSNILAPRIRVNSISPGGVFRNQPKLFVNRYLKKTPLSRMGTEDDVVNAIIFFSSDLSSYITGQNLVVDGGYSNS